jgi:hypothetical protein
MRFSFPVTIWTQTGGKFFASLEFADKLKFEL